MMGMKPDEFHIDAMTPGRPIRPRPEFKFTTNGFIMNKDKKSPQDRKGSSPKSPTNETTSKPSAGKAGISDAAAAPKPSATTIEKKTKAFANSEPGVPGASQASSAKPVKAGPEVAATAAEPASHAAASAPRTPNPSAAEPGSAALEKPAAPATLVTKTAPVLPTAPNAADRSVSNVREERPEPKPEPVARAPAQPDAGVADNVAAVPAATPAPVPGSEQAPEHRSAEPVRQKERQAKPRGDTQWHEPVHEAPHAPDWTPPPHHPVRNPLFIVHISSELAPVAKVGGLADVVFGLSREMEQRGNHVEVILPKYDCMRYDQIRDLQCAYEDLWVPWYGGAIHCSVYFGLVHGRKTFFVEPHSQDNFFNRWVVYGFNDDLMRFAFFSRAALEFLWKSGKHPDIIHCHDWQTALVPVLLFEIYQQIGMTHPRVCFTIHNFKHQGATGGGVLGATGLNRPEYYFHYDRLRDNNNPQALNLMKGGIVYSNFVTTVSPRYASEAKDQGQGFGLEPTLHIYHTKYGGVVNGIDYEVWSSEIDPLIPVNYSVDSLDLKYENKRALRHRLMLADNEKPIVAFVGRLDPQKGIELIRHALFYTQAQGGQFVLLGSSPDNSINAYFWGLKHQFNDNPDVHLEISYNEDLAHLIYAGADIAVAPSRFEPCGLIQLIAMRYGTIPVVREVGGLADTVIDKDFSNRALNERNGYVFRDYDEAGLESALGRAIACYYQYPEHFRELMKNAMRYDYSWNHPGQDYLNIYDFIREK